MIHKMLLLFGVILYCSITSFAQNPHWEHIDFPYDLQNWRVASFLDTLTNEYYVYGKYKSDSSANYCDYSLSLFDGETFTEIGGFSEVIEEVVLFQEKIYAGGGFLCVDGAEDVEYLAIYENESWLPVAEIDNNITAMVVDDNYLYVAGFFTEINGISCNGIARYDGEAWESVGGNGLGDSTWIWNLCFFQGELYAGGTLDLNDEESVKGLRVLRNDEWIAVDDIDLIGISRVTEMIVWQGKLYLIGSFFYSNNPLHTSLIVWDGVEFSAPYPDFYDRYGNIGYGSQVRRLIATDDYLYIAGDMEYIGDQEVNQLVAYDGENFCAMFTEGLKYAIQAIFLIDEIPYAYLYLNPYSNTIYPSALFKWIGGDDFENCENYTSLQSVNRQEVEVYPNPATNQVTINADFQGKLTYALYDQLGRLVSQKNIYAQDRIEISCEGLNSGTYFLHILNEEILYHAKIIVL